MTMREEFEAAFVQRQVDDHGEGFRDSAVHMLKRDGDFESTPTHYELHRRELGMYDSYWVEMVWWAWQASRAALVIDLPEPDSSYENGGYLLPKDKVIESITAAGLKVRP